MRQENKVVKRGVHAKEASTKKVASDDSCCDVQYSPYFMWISISLFFCFQYMLRIVPNVISDRILETYSISADQFATLGSLYFLAYSILQIPLGKCADTTGVHKVVKYSIILCACGSILFSVSHHFVLLQISRLAIGAGSAAALLCALKIVTDYLPLAHRALCMGITLAAGTLGALAAGHIIHVFLQYMEWEKIGIVFAIISIFLLFCFVVSVKTATLHGITQPVKQTTQHTKHAKYQLYGQQYLKDLKKLLLILKNRQVIMYAILSIGFFTPLATLADLWGALFLQQKFLLSHEVAVNASLNLYFGLSLGSIVLPWLADKYSLTNKILILCITMVFSMFTLLVYGPYLTPSILQILLCSIGFFCGAEMLCFSYATRLSSHNNSGEIIGVVNTFNVMGCAVLQQLVGIILDAVWNGTHNELDGTRFYSVTNFTYALLPLSLTIFCCMLLAFKVSPLNITRTTPHS